MIIIDTSLVKMKVIQNVVVLLLIYKASISGIQKYANKTAEEAKEVMQKSVHLARESVEEYWKDYQKKAEASDSTILAGLLVTSLSHCKMSMYNLIRSLVM